MDERVSGRIVRRRLTYPLFCRYWELFFHVLLGLLRPFRLWQGGGEGIRDNRGVRDLPMGDEEGENNGVRGTN